MPKKKTKKDTTGAQDIHEAYLAALRIKPTPLTEREKDVIERYYGFDGNFRHTLQEIAEHYKITRERVRQIKHYALQKIGALSSESNTPVSRKG